MERARAPNRTIDLNELDTPSFRRVLADMDALTARDRISYLHPSKRWEYPWALGRAGLKPGERVLDAGCGASIFPIYLARRGLQVSGYDLQPPAGLAREHGVAVDYVCGDLCRLPYGNSVFDAVFCISVIEHLPPQAMANALAEMHRVLRPGGRLLLTTDYYEDAEAELWYEGDGGPFRVDWSFFDETSLREHILSVPGWAVEGAVDLEVDWPRVKPEMRAFHGYPYTSVGLALCRA